MSYTFTTFDGTSKIFTVADLVVDNNQCPLNLLGRGAVNFGQKMAQNLVFLLENFASASPGTLNSFKPLRGQLWFDTTSVKLKVNTSNTSVANWATVGGATVTDTQPSSPNSGDLWLNRSTNQLLVYNGTSFTLVGPPNSAVQTKSADYLLTTTDDNELMIATSSITFTLPTTVRPGYTAIIKNVNTGKVLVQTGGGVIDNSLSSVRVPHLSTVKLVGDGSGNWYRIDTPTADVGDIKPFSGTAVPPGWLLCDGSAVNRTTYAGLFDVVGTNWGAGNGTSTFNVPDYAGRTLIGAGTGSSLTARTLGQKGGEEAHTMTSNEMVSHTHGTTISSTGLSGTTGTESDSHTHAQDARTGLLFSGSSFQQGGGSGGFGTGGSTGGESTTHTHSFSIAAHTHTITIGSTGGGTPFNVMNPFAVVNFVVKV